LVVLAVVLLMRPAWIFLMFGRTVLSEHVDRTLSVPLPSGGGRGALGLRRQSKPKGKWRSMIDHSALTWQENVVVSWTGMRGVVTLAAAAGIPLTTASGEPFPERALIQAVAFAIAVGTLLLQGSTLPPMIRRLKVSPPEAEDGQDEEALKVEKIVHDAADQVLADFRTNPPEGLDMRVLTDIRDTIARHSQDADHMPDPDEHTLRAEVFSALYRKVLWAQRAALIAERDAGRADDEEVRAMLERLDLQEAGVTARLESRF
jgi:CPA1 family monovalent cation:H+ antiporter